MSHPFVLDALDSGIRVRQPDRLLRVGDELDRTIVVRNGIRDREVAVVGGTDDGRWVTENSLNVFPSCAFDLVSDALGSIFL